MRRMTWASSQIDLSSAENYSAARDVRMRDRYVASVRGDWVSGGVTLQVSVDGSAWVDHPTPAAVSSVSGAGVICDVSAWGFVRWRPTSAEAGKTATIDAEAAL